MIHRRNDELSVEQSSIIDHHADILRNDVKGWLLEKDKPNSPCIGEGLQNILVMGYHELVNAAIIADRNVDNSLKNRSAGAEEEFNDYMWLDGQAGAALHVINLVMNSSEISRLEGKREDKRKVAIALTGGVISYATDALSQMRIPAKFPKTYFKYQNDKER